MCRGDQPFRSPDVRLLRGDSKNVPRRPRHEKLMTDELAQARDIDLHDRRRRRRRPLPPHKVDQLVRRDEFVRVHQERRENRALLTAPERELIPIVGGFEWSEETELDQSRRFSRQPGR